MSSKGPHITITVKNAKKKILKKGCGGKEWLKDGFYRTKHRKYAERKKTQRNPQGDVRSRAEKLP